MSAVLRKVPAKALTYLIYSGDEIDAQQALACGLVSRVIEAAKFAMETEAFVAELAGHAAPSCSRLSKKSRQRHRPLRGDGVRICRHAARPGAGAEAEILSWR